MKGISKEKITTLKNKIKKIELVKVSSYHKQCLRTHQESRESILLNLFFFKILKLRKKLQNSMTQITAKRYPLIIETKRVTKGREKGKFTNQSTLPSRDRKNTNHKPDTC